MLNYLKHLVKVIKYEMLICAVISMCMYCLNRVECLIFDFQVIVPAEVVTMGCGVDHSVALCRAFV